jgi:hypothetical protein
MLDVHCQPVQVIKRIGNVQTNATGGVAKDAVPACSL